MVKDTHSHFRKKEIKGKRRFESGNNCQYFLLLILKKQKTKFMSHLRSFHHAIISGGRKKSFRLI